MTPASINAGFGIVQDLVEASFRGTTAGEVYAFLSFEYCRTQLRLRLYLGILQSLGAAIFICGIQFG